MVGTRLVTGPPDPGPRPHSASVLARPFTASHRHWSVRVQLANCPRGCRLRGHPDSQSILTQPQASAPQDGRRGASQDIGLSSGQTNGPARTASAPQASGASSAISGLNSLSGAIPDLGNAAGAVPHVGNVTGSLSGGQNGGTGTGTMP